MVLQLLGFIATQYVAISQIRRYVDINALEEYFWINHCLDMAGKCTGPGLGLRLLPGTGMLSVGQGQRALREGIGGGRSPCDPIALAPTSLRTWSPPAPDCSVQAGAGTHPSTHPCAGLACGNSSLGGRCRPRLRSGREDRVPSPSLRGPLTLVMENGFTRRRWTGSWHV